MPSVYCVQLVEHFSASSSHSVGDADELLVVADMDFQVREQFVWHIKTDLGHGFWAIVRPLKYY